MKSTKPAKSMKVTARTARIAAWLGVVGTAGLLVFGFHPGPAQGAILGADQLPNLVPLAPFQVQIAPADQTSEFYPVFALRFAVGVANRGGYPFDLVGLPRDPVSGAFSANQCVYWASDGVCAQRDNIGDFYYDGTPSHSHYHLKDYSRYDLRALLLDGTPDMSPQGLVAGGQKVTFCVLDYQRDPGTPQQTHDGNSLYSLCSAGFQGISPGWMDVYDAELEGQQIRIDTVPDGRYAIVVVLDPPGRFQETTHEDNTSWRAIELYGGGTKVRVV